MKLKELAALVGGALEGNPDTEITHCASMARAGAGAITFIEHPRYLPQLGVSRPSAVIGPLSIKTEIPRIEVKHPYVAFAKIIDVLHPEEKPAEGVQPAASVHPSAKVGAGCHIGAFAVVGAGAEIGAGCAVHGGAHVGRGCRVGEGTVIHPNATLYPGVIVGRRSIIHAGAVIGADGFKFIAGEGGRQVKVRHIGGVRIGDDVEIGANTCIDRAMLDETVIGNGVKLDNLVQIGHNCVIGDNTVIAGATAVAGSARIGKNVLIGGQVGIADHVELADGTIVAAKSGVTSSIGPGIFGGAYALPIHEWRRAQAAFNRGAETLKRLSALEKRKEKD